MNEKNRGSWTSASNAEADELCPGRHLASRDLVERQTKDAAHGDLIHQCLKIQDPTSLDPEQTEIYDGCNQIATKQANDYFGPDIDKAREFREQRLWVTYQYPGPPTTIINHSGMADRYLIRGTKALIQDYKTLAGEVAASPENRQLRDLAVLLAGQVPVLDEIAVSPIQPLHTYSPTLCIYRRPDLIRAAEDMRARVIASNDPAKERIPGPVQCKFCKAASAGRCLEYARWAGSHVPQLYTVSNVPVADWTPEQRADYCERRLIAYRWLEQTDEAMKAGLTKDPNFVPGYWMEPGDWREYIVNPQAVFDRLVALGGKLEDYMPCINVVKKDLKAQVAKITGLKGKKLTDALTALLKDLTERHQNKPSLAKKKDV